MIPPKCKTAPRIPPQCPCRLCKVLIPEISELLSIPFILIRILLQVFLSNLVSFEMICQGLILTYFEIICLGIILTSFEMICLGLIFTSLEMICLGLILTAFNMYMSIKQF